MRKRKQPIRSARSMIRWRSCWADQAPSGWAVTPRDVYPAGRCLHDEQHLQTRQEDGVHGEEITRQQALRLSAQERSPGGIQAARSGPVPPRSADPADGRLADVVAEPGQLAVDSAVAPSWVLRRQPQHLIPIGQAGLLDLVAGEQEVAPGIHVVPAPGHTPGHLAIWLTSGSQHAVFVADAVLGETNFAHPDWTSVFDTDRAQAARTR